MRRFVKASGIEQQLNTLSIAKVEVQFTSLEHSTCAEAMSKIFEVNFSIMFISWDKSLHGEELTALYLHAQ